MYRFTGILWDVSVSHAEVLVSERIGGVELYLLDSGNSRDTPYETSLFHIFYRQERDELSQGLGKGLALSCS